MFYLVHCFFISSRSLLIAGFKYYSTVWILESETKSVRNIYNTIKYNSMDIVIGLCHDDRIDIDTFSESVESSSKLS